jgi:hypothetical protein
LAAESWQADSDLRIRFIRLYAQHEPFQTGLAELFAQYVAPIEPLIAGTARLFALRSAGSPHVPHPQRDEIATYLAGLHALAVQFGLHRLDASTASDRTSADGEQLIHNWCQLRADTKGQAGYAVEPRDFEIAYTAGRWIAPFGEVVSHVEEHIGTSPDGAPIVVVDEQRRPLVHVEIASEWDPRHEARAGARARLLAIAAQQIDAELEKIAGQAEKAGYSFPDTAPKLDEHLRWLFERVALGKSCQAIAAQRLGSWTKQDRVSHETKHLATRIGVRLAG